MEKLITIQSVSTTPNQDNTTTATITFTGGTNKVLIGEAKFQEANSNIFEAKSGFGTITLENGYEHGVIVLDLEDEANFDICHIDLED